MNTFGIVTSAICALIITPAISGTIIVQPSGFASIDLDIDGDSQPEVFSFHVTDGPPPAWIPPGPGWAVSFASDLPADYSLPAGSARFAPLSIQSFVTIAALQSASIYSGTAELVMVSQEGLNVTDLLGSQIPFDFSTPVIAAWLWGTLGRISNQPEDTVHHLVGWVIDASAHAADDSQPITIYYNNYGPFREGSSAQVSLAATGVPEPGTMLLLSGLLVRGGLRRRPQSRS